MVTDSEVTQKIERFFQEYEKRFADGISGKIDVNATVESFAPVFLEAHPHGISCNKNDEKFRANVPKGYDFYRNIGTTKMRIDFLDITPLDDFHYMAKVYWKAYYIRKDKSLAHIDFSVIYMLQMVQDQPKIFTYITGDEQKVLRDNGLIQ